MNSLSKRAAAVRDEVSPLIKAHFECETDPYHAQRNPQGAINLGTAENYLMDREILEWVLEPLELRAPHLHYAPFHGLHSLRQAIAGFYEQVTGLRGVDPEAIVVGAGGAALLESLAFCLFDAGEGVLIPAPYYSGFEQDFSARFGVKVLLVPMSADDGFGLDINALGSALCEAEGLGIRVRAVLVNNPHNPLGIVYTQPVLRALVEFAARNKLEIITDEIYTHSCYQPGAEAPTSLLELAGSYRPHVHRLYGLAKDFALSGFRVGFLYSENTELRQSLQNHAYFHNVSNHTQVLVEKLLSDPARCRRFFRASQEKLRRACIGVKQRLTSELRAPFVDACAGLFIFFSLEHFLDERSFAAERRLYERIWRNARVNLTPGENFRCPRPGWFRLCFAQPEEVLDEAFHRIGRALRAAC